MKKCLILLLLVIILTPAYSQIITTIAGNGSAGFSGDGLSALTAEINGPGGIAVDKNGNIYIADLLNNRIRKVTTSGIITTIAGDGSTGIGGDGGPATIAQLDYPTGVAVDKYGNIYVAELNDHRVRKIDTSGIISTYAGNGTGGYSGDGGMATNAQLALPIAIIVDSSGNLYIAQDAYSVIRKVDILGIITTIAGVGVSAWGSDGIPATASAIDEPNGVAVDDFGNIYISDNKTYRIRKVNNAGIISTVAGNGSSGFSGDNSPATAAQIYGSAGIAVDQIGNMYFCDGGNESIRKVNTSGVISTVAGGGTMGLGDGGPAKNCELYSPISIAIDKFGNLYIGDYDHERIRFITSTVFINIINDIICDLEIFPNPSNGVFQINLHAPMDESINITIIDVFENKLYEINSLTNTYVNIKLNIPNGTYFIKVKTMNGNWVKSVSVNNGKIRCK